MNGSTILKKVLPIILTIVLIVIVTVTVSAVKTNREKGAEISDPDGFYVKVEETIGDKTYTYSMTRQELYEQLKYGIGLSTTITMINKDVLKQAKNDEGTSFWDSVTAEAITAAIDEACYGEDVVIADLTAEEKTDLETTFMNTMYSGYGYQADTIYGDEIKEHYRLVLAKEAYAKYCLDKEIAEADEDDPYFSDDNIEDYYDENYGSSSSYWMILVPFTSTDKAKLTLQQLGYAVGESSNDYIWKKITFEAEKDDADNETGALKETDGDDLSTYEVVKAIIDLYNTVYGYKAKLVEGTATIATDADDNKYYEFSEGCDYAIVDVSTEIEAARAAIIALKTQVDSETPDMETFTPLYDAAVAAVNNIKVSLTTDVVESLIAKLSELNSTMSGSAEGSIPTLLYTDLIDLIGSLSQKTIVFNTENLESPIYTDYETLYAYDSNLPSKFESNYDVYVPFVSVNSDDPSWYTTSILSSNSVYYAMLKIAQDEPKELADVEDEIIAKLKEEEITDTYIETKMAELRNEYGILIYDKEIQTDYITALADYEVEFKKSNKVSSENIAKISKDDYEKVYTADDLFNYMEKTSGLATAVSELAYQRLLYSGLFNTYKDFETGEWLGDEGEELKDSIVSQVENQRLYFLSGSYTDYGYDPSTMTWEEFLYNLNGVKDEYELADMMVYSSVSSDYIAKALEFVETDGEGYDITFNQSYADALASEAWKLVEKRMQGIADETFSVTGEHLLVSMYETVKDYVDAGTPIDPKEWTTEQQDLAKELIANVQLYLQCAEGTYAEKLQAVVTAFEAAPYAVKDTGGNYVTAIDADGENYDYVLKCAEVTIDLAKYKSAGLYLKYESLGTFANGSMVENFENAAKEIWEKDMEDDVTDRITVYPNAIETEYGYHLYVNLGSTAPTTFESYVYDANGIPTKDANDEYVTVESVIPSLNDVRLYAMNTALTAVDTTDMSDEDKEALQELLDYYTEVLTTEFTTAITTYYTAVTDDISGSYFTSILLQNDIIKLLDAAGATLNSPSNYTIANIKEIVKINYDSAYEENITTLEPGDDSVYDITAIFSK